MDLARRAGPLAWQVPEQESKGRYRLEQARVRMPLSSALRCFHGSASLPPLTGQARATSRWGLIAILSVT
eukprot:scaffold8456_cov210-Pinguiococcus_pyrenoidosus.AAC.4